QRRRRLLVRIGLSLIALFIVLRAGNVYGDPRPWAPQSSVLFSLFFFLNTTKYPHIVLRAGAGFGEPRPWAPQSSVLFWLFPFVNTTKYPVSLLYLLMTIGPTL